MSSFHEFAENPSIFHTLGIHPWFEISEPMGVFDRIKKHYLENANCLGIGECGLDKMKGLPFNQQLAIFEQLIQLANDINAPLVIHCVRAFDDVLYLYKTHAKTPWAIHGYTRNKDLAKQLIDAGLYISVPLADSMPPTMVDTLSFIPIESIFIESDNDYSVALEKRYALLSTIKNIEIDVLKDAIYNNFTNFFKQKWKFQIG